MIQLIHPVRLAVRQEFASQFNAQLAQACTALDIDSFEINGGDIGASTITKFNTPGGIGSAGASF